MERPTTKEDNVPASKRPIPKETTRSRPPDSSTVADEVIGTVFDDSANDNDTSGC